jgi:hypothetical protein
MSSIVTAAAVAAGAVNTAGGVATAAVASGALGDVQEAMKVPSAAAKKTLLTEMKPPALVSPPKTVTAAVLKAAEGLKKELKLSVVSMI